MAKQHYLRHLSTTIKPAQPSGETVAVTPALDPGVVVVTPPNAPRP